MDELKELIDKFWAKKLSADEQVRLSEIINGDTGLLKNSLEKDYQHDLLSMTDQVAERRFQNILKELHLKIENSEQQSSRKTVSLFKPLKWVAALLIMTLGAGLYLYKHHEESPKLIMAKHSVPKRSRVLQREYNSGRNEAIVKLSDGSVVTLQPGSSLSYYKPFVSTTRSISMNGEVTFKVAKDKFHPFIVTAQGFTTTALGTKFTINTKKSNQILVKLMEGKVVIKTTQSSGMNMKDVYLIPGQQLSINTYLKRPYITNFNATVEIAAKKSVITASKIPMIFKEDTLNNVFDQLAKHYKIQIRYEGVDPQEIRKLFFTGTFMASETLDNILPVICNMNNLNFKRNSNSIVISKQK